MNNKIGLGHYHYLLDDFGIWQHTTGKKIDKKMGYALDDAARGLVVAALLGLKEEARILLGYIERSIKSDCNFFTGDRRPVSFPISHDALGQVYWATNLCLVNQVHTAEAERILKKINSKIVRIGNNRGKNYLLLGAVHSNSTLAKEIGIAMKEEFRLNSSKNWRWIEEKLCYGNGIIPLSFLATAKKNRDDELKNIGLEMLDFLNTETKLGEIPIAIGNRGWYPKDGQKNIYDQQPIDPAYQVMANVEAYKQTKNNKYKEDAKQYFSWFWGNNIARKPLIDISDESCRDGITKSGLSENRGSENIVCYLIAQHYMSELEEQR